MSRFGLGLISSSGVPGNDTFTKILLHMDGSNGGTTFTDVNAGGSPKTWTATNTSGTSTLTTSTSKFGTASLLTSGNSTYISTPGSSEFYLGSGDFTIDFWFNNGGVSSGGALGMCGQTDATASFAGTSFYFFRWINAAQINVGNGTSNGVITGTTSLLGSSWFHIAAVRVSGVLKLFVNGIQEGGNLSWPYAVPSVNFPLVVGQAGIQGAGGFSSAGFKYDEFRFSNGVARWTANFTPPTAPYT